MTTNDIINLTTKVVAALGDLHSDLTRLHELVAGDAGHESVAVSAEQFVIARAKAGHSQRSIARVLGRSQKDIWLLETGKKPNLTAEELVQAALALKVPASFLVGTGDAEMPIAVRIKRRRKILGLTQKELADKMGVNTSTICIWEKQGTDRLDEEKLRHLAAQLSMDYADLVGSTPVPKKRTRLIKASG